jgi:hypothetical protein
VVSAAFRYGLCGEEAAQVALVPVGEPDPRLAPETPDMPPGISTLMSRTSVLSFNGGPVSFSIAVGEPHFEDVKNALVAGDAASLFVIYYEFAPFWCPTCGCCYCRAHYASRAVYDDGFFDCYRGTCSKGHERTLTD